MPDRSDEAYGTRFGEPEPSALRSLPRSMWALTPTAAQYYYYESVARLAPRLPACGGYRWRLGPLANCSKNSNCSSSNGQPMAQLAAQPLQNHPTSPKQTQAVTPPSHTTIK